MACNYSTKFIPLIVSKAEAFGNNVEGLKNWFTKSFNDGLNVYTRYMSGALFVEKSTAPTAKVYNRPYWGRFSQDSEYDAVSDYFKGSNDLQIQSEHAFKTQIVKRLVFDITAELEQDRWKNPSKVDTETGVSAVNEVIAEYKQDLCNAILSEIEPETKVSLNKDLSDAEFNKVIQDVLAKYRQFLGTNPNVAEKYNEFATLSLFDEYLKQYAPFVTVKPEFVNNVTNQIIKTDSFDKYVYNGPNVEHYTGYTSSEFAAIENQDSDLAKLLLDTIPDLNEDGNPIKGSFIGLSGFNAAMSSLKNWILYEAPINVRNEYNKGDEANIQLIIDKYLSRNKNLNNTIGNIYSDRTTFLNGKLKSISHYLFDPKADRLVRSMFSNMFFKTEPISYRTYSYDPDRKQTIGSNLKNAFINAQKFNVEDIVRSVTYLIKTSPSHRANLFAKYNVSYDRRGGFVTISKIGDLSKSLTITLRQPRNKYVTGTFGDDSRNLLDFKKEVINDFLMFIVPDTYEQVGRSMEKDNWVWANDFAPFIGVAAYTLASFAGKGRVSSSIVRFGSNNLVELGDFTDSTLRIAKKLSVIYGSETKNVVKNLSGSNLPLYQLTNLTYNLPNVIDDIQDAINRATVNPESEYFDQNIAGKAVANKNNLLVQARQLLIPPQVRQEVQYGGMTKAASQLTIKELLRLNVFNDFYQNLIDNSDPEYGKIYLQSATYADKSTHYLFGYDLNKTITVNGEKLNLCEIITNIINNKTDSSRLVEIIRKLRADRINAITKNIVDDYRKVFGNIADFNNINDVVTFLQGKNYDGIVKAFEEAGVKFYEEYHGTKPRYEGAPSIALNETMLNYYNTFNDSELFKQRIDKAREAFIRSIDENYWTWNRYDDQVFDKLYENDKYKSFKDVNGNIKTHIGSKLHPILEAYFLSDVLLSNEVNSLLIGEVWAHPNKNKRQTNLPKQYDWGRYDSNNYEVSSKGDSRFSARFAKFSPGTILFGNNVGERTIESVYQHGVKQNDWVTNNNNKTGVPKSNIIIKGNTEDDSYRDGYLPLWREWAKQNPELIKDLTIKANGKVLTDQFASSRVSQARALAQILSEINNDEEEGTYEEFSEANRLIAQIKRSVAFGATYHPYLQHKTNGVASEIRIAVIKDIPGIVFTPNGDEKTDLDSSDGSGIAHPLQSRFENNSLVDAKVGKNKKSIMMDVDSYYGRPTLLKWAVYELSNENRRNGTLSNANLERIYSKMSDGYLPVSSDMLNNYTSGKDIYYKDYKTGSYYKILGFEGGNSDFITRIKIEINPNTLETIGNEIREEFTVDTLYKLDQILGGAWTGEFKDGNWEYNEAQLDVIEKIVSENCNDEEKGDLFIGYLVNKSAIKVGAGNTNDDSSWSNDTALSTIKMKTKYGGVQMDADHELDMAEVTEMTQMISALIEDGHYKDIVESIYNDIGGVVASHVAKLDNTIKQVIETGSPESKQKLYEILARSWISSFENKSKDTIGIAQAFVKKASDAFKRNNFDIRVPFSAATINGSFVSDVIASINKGGIRHKYEGFAGVLNPSHDMIQYFRIYNGDHWETRMFDEFADYSRELAAQFGTNWDGLFNTFSINGKLNPLLKEVAPNEIDFEDSVVVLDENNDIVETDNLDNTWYINSFTTYDKLKTLLRRNPNYKVYINTGKPRNLKATNTKFTINGTEYSIYDLDSVRASQYLTKALNDKKKRYIDALTPDQLTVIKRVLGWRFNVDDVRQNPKSLIANAIILCNNKTQDILKRIEQGLSFEASEAFGIKNSEIGEGIIIQKDILKAEKLKFGTRKDIDLESLIPVLEGNSQDLYRLNVTNWIKSILQDPNNLLNAPVGISNGIIRDAQRAQQLRKRANNLIESFTKYEKGNITEIANAEINAEDALNEVIDRICNDVFDIQPDYIVRKLYDSEPTQSLNVYASSYRVEPAEIITGRYQWEKFGLGQNDNIFDITSSNYFYSKLQSKYNVLPEYVESNLFDGVLFGNNEQFLFIIGSLPKEFNGTLSESTDFRNLEGNIYYNGQKVSSAENKKFYTYEDETGKKHHIIQLNSISDFIELKNSTLFDNVVRYNWNENNFDVLTALKYEGIDQIKIYTDPTNTKKHQIIDVQDLTLDQARLDEEIRLDKRISCQAKDMYDSFNRQLNYVGARIPTQAMQSFMAMRLIGVTNAKQNVVYVPKSQTYLEGSDYDIDKLYIMAHSVNPNGLVQIGTPIQSKYGLDFVSKLHRPEGKQIQMSETPEEAVVLTQRFIEQFDFNELENSEILEAYNAILENGNIYVEPYVNDGMISQKRYQSVANTILKEINSYSNSLLTSTSDPNYLKNRVVSGIWEITNKLQNQMVSQIPVDMGDPQKAAEQSTLGKAELHINSDNPAAKMMMQQQNAIGKEVIGISAVSLKAFFGLYYYYSELTNNLKQACINNDITEISNTINKLVFTHPLTGKTTSLANIDIEQVIDVIRTKPELKEIDILDNLNLNMLQGFINQNSNKFRLLDFCKYLQQEVNKTDAALTDSAVISAATDNAKELILAKINATPELVDIYTYLTATGTPFLDIAEFMTCESFGFVTKAGEVDIFNESTHNRKVKTALDWFLGKNLLPGTDTILLGQFLGFEPIQDENGQTRYATKQMLIDTIQDRDRVERAIKRCNDLLENPIYNNDVGDEFSEYNGKKIGVDKIPNNEIRGVINVLEWQLKAFDFKSKLSDPVGELTKLTKISELLPNVKEMSTMGQAQGINQGQRTSLYSNRGFIKRVNDYVNDVFESAEIKETFNFDNFVRDEEYRNRMIQTYGTVKKSFNILEALTSLPHFWEMLKTTSISKSAIKQSAWRSNVIWNLADSIEENGVWLSEDDWNNLDKYLTDYAIAYFLKQNDFKFKVPIGTTYYSGMSLDGKLINKVKDYEIDLNSVVGIASFKRFVEDVVVPHLKSNINFATNPFISNLIPYANISADRIITGWKLPLDMMNIDASPNTKLLFANILSGFDDISNQSVFGMKLGDIFYLYNLIVNKDGYGRSSFTRLFENTINSDDSESLAYKFNEFISKLDSGEITLEPNLDEAIYRIKKLNPDFGVKTTFNTYIKLPSDFTLDLPDFFDLPTKNRNVSNIDASKVTIDLGTTDAVYSIAQAIAYKYNDAISMITDEELTGYPDVMRNAKAFIQDGKVWININSANASDALHELTHLVLASMKFSDDSMIRQTYYNLVSSMMDRQIVPEERFNNIIKAYVRNDGLVTSDILEEVLANEFSYYLSGELLGETSKLITANVETNVLKAIADVLELDKAPTLSDIQGKTLTEIMQALGKNILNVKSIDSNFIVRTQKVAKMEDMLYRDKKLTCA